MAKASSPVRLESTLMEAAAVSGSVLHRSAAEQIEYWADIGRKVSSVVSTESLLAISAGLVQIKLETVAPVAIDPDAVFANLDRQRQSGALTDVIASGGIRYQASRLYPGLLEQIHPDGTVIIGQFYDGGFQAQNAG